MNSLAFRKTHSTRSHTRFFRTLPNRPVYMFAPVSGQLEGSERDKMPREEFTRRGRGDSKVSLPRRNQETVGCVKGLCRRTKMSWTIF